MNMKKSIRRFFKREEPANEWELNKQAREMETRATITLAIVIALSVLNIAIALKGL